MVWKNIKLELKNKSSSAFYSDMKKIILEKKKDGINLFPSKKPSKWGIFYINFARYAINNIAATNPKTFW